MDLIAGLATGLAVAFTPSNLVFCLLGALVGTLVGVLPGIAPVATIAILLPFTSALPPAASLIMLAGIFYGAQYGGSTTAILVNLPGESSAIVTCLDGHQMARQGRAGPALAIAAIASFYAGTIATIVIATLSVPMSWLALRFHAADYFSLMIVGMIGAIVLANGSPAKAVAMALLGLSLGLVGLDVNSGVPRLTLDIPELSDGIGFVPVAMGLFGIAELIVNLERPQDRNVLNYKALNLMPRWAEIRACLPAMTRGTILGSVLGVLPGGGAALSSFAAYALEKKVARDPSRFGRGAMEGVAAPEAANNAGAQTSFIPLLTLGIPGNAIMALMVGAMMIQGIQPGPQMMTEQPQLFWGVIASMWAGNLMLIVINLPLIGIWVSLLRVPYRLMFPAIILFCCIGAYSLNNTIFDVWIMLLFGIIGVFFIKVGAEPAPFILGFVLGPMMEEYFRRAMNLSKGDPTVFVTRPISAFLLLLAAILLLILILPSVRSQRDTVFREQ